MSYPHPSRLSGGDECSCVRCGMILNLAGNSLRARDDLSTQRVGHCSKFWSLKASVNPEQMDAELA
jgi:hypothetical protein